MGLWQLVTAIYCLMLCMSYFQGYGHSLCHVDFGFAVTDIMGILEIVIVEISSAVA